MKLNLKIWKDILTEKAGNEKLYSQGRVYLLFSVIAYYIILGIVTWKALIPTIDIKEDTLKTIIDALQWTILLFSSYSLGGKVINGAKTMFGKQIDNTDKDVKEN